MNLSFIIIFPLFHGNEHSINFEILCEFHLVGYILKSMELLHYHFCEKCEMFSKRSLCLVFFCL